MNFRSVYTIFSFEMSRMKRTLGQSLASPVISTSLYFVVFGSAFGERISEIDGLSYGAYIVPGVLMLSIMNQSIANASFGIFFPKFTKTIDEVLSAPVSSLEIAFGYVGAAATKSIILGLLILFTARLFVDFHVDSPILMLTFLILTAVTFSMLGFLIGIHSNGFEQLQVIPTLVITPLAFLGGSFYSVKMLPQIWQDLSLFNPVLYLISGLRHSFYGTSDVSLWLSFRNIFILLAICIYYIYDRLNKGSYLKR